MSHQEIRDTVSQFIRSDILFDEKRELQPDQSLLGSGILDSTGVLELISFLEVTYNLKFTDDELIAENFDSVNKIAAFVQAKLITGRSAHHVVA